MPDRRLGRGDADSLNVGLISEPKLSQPRLSSDSAPRYPVFTEKIQARRVVRVPRPSARLEELQNEASPRSDYYISIVNQRPT